MKNIYEKLINEYKEDRVKIITTNLSFSNKGDIKEFHRDINSYEDLKEDERKQVIEGGKPKCFDRKNGYVFAEPYFQKERVVIFGGGHIAIPLVKFAKITGFYVIVIDDRPSFANSTRFPNADEVICESFKNCISRIKPQESDYYVIVTRGHRHDTICIKELMKYKESVYTGMIGSKKRTKIVIKNLEEDGYDKDRLLRICTPIGIPIGAATTEEIGISIMAEIIKRRRMEIVKDIPINRSDLETDIIANLAINQEPCAVITIMESSGSVPRSAGAKMIVYRDGRILGSIGGGCVEASVITKARELIGTNKYQVMALALDGEDAMAEGMVCGGSIKLLIEDCLIK